MLAALRRHLSFANVTSLAALFVALGGTSYAALRLPRDSVGSAQVRDGSLRARDLAPGALRPGPAGPRGVAGGPGPTGPVGPQGTRGGPILFAHLTPSGGVDPARSNGVVQANVAHPQTGVYCLSGLPFAPTSVVANADYDRSGVDEVVQTAIAPGAGDPCAGSQALVYVAIQGQTRDAGLYVLVS